MNIKHLIYTTTILTSAIVHMNIISMNCASKITKLGFSALCSTTELFLLSIPLLDKIIFSNPNKKQSTNPGTSKLITNFVNSIGKSKNINNIKVILDDNAHAYGIDDNNKILYIPKKEAQQLESLLQKTKLTPKEQKIKDYHESTIHHELAHIDLNSLKKTPLYDTLLGTTAAFIISQTVSKKIKNLIPHFQNNYIPHNTFKLVRGVGALYLTFNLSKMNIYKKYDELKADEGIPNSKTLLKAQAKKYESRHKNLINVIETAKKHMTMQHIIFNEMADQLNRPQLIAMKLLPIQLFNIPLVMDIIFHARAEHLSDIRRAKKFRYRIAQL